MSDNIMYIFTISIEKEGFTGVKSISVDSFIKVETTRYISISKLQNMMKLYDADLKTTCENMNIDYGMVEQDCRDIRGMMIREKFSEVTEGLFGVITNDGLDRSGLQNVLDMHYEDGTLEKFLHDAYIGEHTEKLY